MLGIGTKGESLAVLYMTNQMKLYNLDKVIQQQVPLIGITGIIIYISSIKIYHSYNFSLLIAILSSQASNSLFRLINSEKYSETAYLPRDFQQQQQPQDIPPTYNSIC